MTLILEYTKNNVRRFNLLKNSLYCIIIINIKIKNEVLLKFLLKKYSPVKLIFT